MRAAAAGQQWGTPSESADVDESSTLGYTTLGSLCNASHRGELELIHTLLDAKADVNGLDKNSDPPLVWACKSPEQPSKVEAIEALIQGMATRC